MTALAGSLLNNMPFIEQPYGSFSLCATDSFYPVDCAEQFVKTEYYQPQKQLQPQQAPQQPQEQYSMLPISGSTSPQQPVPNVVFSPNSQLSQFDNNDQNVKFEPVSSIPIKSEFGGYNLDMDSVSSAGSSPHLVASNEFDNQFNYSYPPLCEEPQSEATSPTTDLHFPLNDQIAQYYELCGRSAIDHQNSQPPFDQMRFIIYEPRQNDNTSLVPNINSQNTYGMWPVSIQQNGNIDNRSIPTNPQPMQPISFDYPSNPVLVNPAQINPLPSTSSSPQQQPAQQPQSVQNQQQLIKCPHEECTKTFSRLYNLKAHLRSHSPARPYQCPMCPRSFSRKHDLQRHIRVHTGVKPYQCPCCCKAFARTDALRRHFKMEENCRKSPE
ncbi:36981_t:CDS:1, partial [Racocetra persica]